MRVNIRVIFLPVLTCLLLLGCDLTEPSDETSLECGTDLAKGSFEAEISGYVDKSFQGEAVFETLLDITTSNHIFFLMLSDIEVAGDKYRSIMFERRRHSTPGVGRYNLANLEKPHALDRGKFIAFFDDTEISGKFRFKSTGGVLKICSSNNKVLKGVFDFPAYELISAEGGEYEKVEVRITGAFHAEAGDTGIIIF